MSTSQQPSVPVLAGLDYAIIRAVMEPIRQDAAAEMVREYSERRAIFRIVNPGSCITLEFTEVIHPLYRE